MLSLPRRKIRGTQGKLEVVEAGSGAGLPVLFLHADSGNSDQWREVLHGVARERRAITFDFRGHGASEPAENEDYGYTGRAEDVASVVDALHVERFVVAAHSGGAAVALQYAVTHPERVAGLLLVDPPSDPRALPQAAKDAMLQSLAGPRSLEAQKAFYATLAGANPRVIDRVLAGCDTVVASARLGVAEALARWNPESTLNAWHGRIYVLSSPANDNDQALYNLRPDIAHEVVPGVGHWIQLENPALVTRALRRFTQDIEAAEGVPASQRRSTSRWTDGYRLN
jgi:pimeloyl-ACP methyl ester carboxylesterase